jgi:hypothetical protein
MLKPPSDRFTVSETEATVMRKCPFCDWLVEDASGKNIEFIVHLGSPTAEHQRKQPWADYLAFMHRI